MHTRWFLAIALVFFGCKNSAEDPVAQSDAGAMSNGADAAVAAAGGDAGKPRLGPGDGYDFSDVQDECGLHTQYPGDVLCLKPPAPDKGFQIHLGPSNYDDEKEVAKYLLQPSEEKTECMYFRTGNDDTITYYERLIHMRPVSHHIFLWLVSDDAAPPADKMNEWTDCYGSANLESQIGVIGGGESPITALPPHGKYAPENIGLGRALLKNRLVRVEIHAFNPGTKAVLREAWANVYYKPKEEVTQWVQDVGLYGGLSYNTAPHTREVMHNEITVTDSSRWITAWGHGHAHMVRFSAWRRRGAERTQIIEDFDWQHPTTLAFDSITTNKAADPTLLLAGGHSGILEVEKGDVIEWECEVDNTSDNSLRYINSVQGGEMCNFFGEFLGNGGGIGTQYKQGTVTKLQ